MPHSYHQERLWFIDQFETGVVYDTSPIYHNLPLVLRLRGELDREAVQVAFTGLLERHAILRSRLGEDREWIVDEPGGADVETIDTDPAGDDHDPIEAALAWAARPFELVGGRLIRAGLLTRGAEEHLLVVAVHHIVADRHSLRIIAEDFGALYRAAATGSDAPEPPEGLTYADFARWQLALPEEALEQLLFHWKYTLAPPVRALEIPEQRARPAVHTFTAGRYAFPLDAGLAAAVDALGKRLGCSEAAIMLAAFKVVLRRYAKQDEIVVGTSAHGRTEDALERMVGPIANLLVLRDRISGDAMLGDVVAGVHKTLEQAHRHQAMPFDLMVTRLNPAKDMSRTALFDVLFQHEGEEGPALDLPGLEAEVVETNVGYGKYDLHLVVRPAGEGHQAALVFNTDIFDRSFVEQMMRHFVAALRQVASQPDQRVDDVVLLDQADVARESSWNETAADYPEAMTVHGLLEKEVDRTPDRIAVGWGASRTTYAELDRRSNRVARHLRERGVRPDQLVGLFFDRSDDMIVAMLAVLKAGAGYLPLDPASPAERLAFIVEDARLEWIVSSGEAADRIEGDDSVVRLDRAEAEIAAQSSVRLPLRVGPDNIAYCIYTSGSTGKPKGVLVRHRNVVRLLHNDDFQFDISEDDVWTMFHSYCFDFSVWEMYGALLYGGKVVIVPETVTKDPDAFVRLLRAEGVTVLNQTPGYFSTVMRAAREDTPAALTLRYVVFGGEALDPARLSEWHAEHPAVRLINMYGITETTVHNTFKRLTAESLDRGISNIGRPIPTTTVHVVDEELRLLPVGVPGELHVGGLGLARGYLHRPALTAARFLPDPLTGQAGARLYKTGDVGRHWPDGDLEFLGRADDQIKIRGYRVELGEVESVVAQHPSVKDAVVLLREDTPGDARLVAYTTASDTDAVSVTDLRRFVARQLPDYMVPGAFVPLASFPLTPNGKVDKRALPAPDQARPELADAYAPPEGPIQEALVEIWSDVLGVDRVGVNDNFFQLGGHSLLATQVVSRVRSRFDVEIPLRELFENPTVAGYSAAVEEASGTGAESIPTAPRDGDLPLSFAQGRLWFLDRLEQVRESYNVAAAVRLSGPLRVDALAQVIDEVVARHESLRTTFEAERGRPRQVVHERGAVDVRLVDLERMPVEQAATVVKRLAGAESRARFDLAEGPLMRVVALRLGEDEHVVLFTVHHIVSDGWSMGVLVREVAELYERFARGEASGLDPLPVQYADFAVWQREWVEGGGLDEQSSYWKSRLLHAPQTLELPTDRARPAVQTFEGAKVSLRFDTDLSDRLRTFSEREGLTPFMTLLAGLFCLLGRYSGQDDLVVGSPIAGRNRAEIEGLIGFFVNTLVLRADLSGDPTVAELLARVRETALGAYANQDLPLEELLDELDIERDLSRSPLFQVVFALQNAPVQALELGALRLEPVELGHETAKFDLLVNLGEDEHGYHGVLEYNTALFDAETIERLGLHLERFVSAMVADPGVCVSELEMATPEERGLQVDVWNAARESEPDTVLPHHRFEQWTERTPDAVALTTEAGLVTYAALNARANRLAHHLRARGVGPETLVGLCLDRSVETVVGILGVLKAGGAYVPLDPAHPPDRLAFIAADAGLHSVLVDGGNADRLTDATVAVLDLGVAAADIATAPATVPLVDSHPDNVAYVIYTSGSTGKPKGTPVSHRNVARLFTATEPDFGFTADDVWTLFHSYAFDFSVWELWGALAHGGRLVVVPYATSRAPDAFLESIHRERVTVLNQTPSAFRQLVAFESAKRGDASTALRYVVFGGEALDVRQLASWVERHGAERPRLVNMYGITETTVHVTYGPLTANDLAAPGAHSPVGRPIRDLRLYVLEPSGALAAVGVPGEAFVAGGGVARGYLGRPGLTAERFVPSPFGNGERLYRTGDAARYLRDGSLAFVGRVDQQVKIRGFRIELGEIEAALVACDGVGDAVVLSREETPGQARLVGYVVPDGASAPTLSELRASLLAELPDYMVPSAFVTLDALPLTANGKLDRRALPAPAESRPDLDTTYSAPTGSTEEVIASIWSEVLGVDRVGRDDNFFELGGSSLLIVEVHARLVEWLERDLPVVELFQYPTVNALARHLGGEPDSASTPTVAYRSNRTTEREPIAVVGMAGRFPGAADVDAFWENLKGGVESIRVFTDEELEEAGVPRRLLDDPSYVKAKGWLDGVDLFDAMLFGYSPREAELTDPQQRLFLQCAQEALENAGYDPRRYEGAIGVFGGERMNSYAASLQHVTELWGTGGGIQAALSSDKDHLTTRVSYKLNLRGPSVNVQTACSTSLVAIHQACRSILDGECDMALAGGVSVSVPLAVGYHYREDGIVSPDGHCRPFDADAKGTVSGNGVALVVLKRLSQALEDGDHVHGVVLGTAINNDGGLKVGYTAPSVEGQAEVISAALDVAGVEPESIGYVEAHGTGTALGDPIEVAALTRALGPVAPGSTTRWIGAVKSNFGHLDAAAGVAGFVKAVLCLEHESLVPTVWFRGPNPRIDFAAGGFAVSDALRPWETDGAPRRAGVSSFGIGGTNAHVVLEEPPARSPSSASRPWQTLLISAKTRSALTAATERLADHLEAHPHASLADVAYTLRVGRQEYEQRRAVVCDGVESAVDELRALDPARTSTGVAGAGRRSVVFMFTGQGAQYPDMGRELYEAEPVFRDVIDRCAVAAQAYLDFDLRDVLYPGLTGDAGLTPEAAAARLKETSLTQPALFAVELALARLVMSWGITPAAMIGHSIGEYTAACVAGVLTEEDALRVVCERGRLMHAAPTGSMMAVSAASDTVAPLLDGGLCVAAVNAPGSCVVSGGHEEVDALETRLTDEGIDCHRLRTSHAFHSELMESAVEPFVEIMRGLDIGEPAIPYLSNVTGDWIDAATVADPAYWGRQLRGAVLFADGVGRLLEDEDHVLLEIGPGDTLRNVARGYSEEASERAIISTLPHPRDGGSASASLDFALGQLWVAGVELDWDRCYAGERRHRVPLPTYPFQTRSFWVDPPARTLDAPAARGRKADLADWFYTPSWRRTIPPMIDETAADTTRRWVVYCEDTGLGHDVCEWLGAAGHRVTRVRSGDAYEAADGVATIDPGEPADYSRLLDEITGDGPVEVLHFWTLTGPTGPDGEDVEDVEARTARMMRHGFHGLLHLARSLGPRLDHSGATVTVFTDRAHDVTGQDTVDAEKALVIGPARVIPREYPGLLCSTVDVGDGAIDARQAVAEHLSRSEDDTVAYRGRQRLALAHEPVRIDSAPASSAIEPGGVYLVTGGLGGVGLALAEHLGRTADAKLVLTSRTPMPERGEWDAWLASHEEDDRISARIRGVQRIEASGAEVLVAAADVSDETAMRAVLEEADARFGPVRGVIHAAGLADGALISLRSDDVSDAVLAPKVMGTLVLERVLGDRPLDFFVLCSSLASIQAPAGQVAYCAANAFLDAYAHARSARDGVRTVSINWDTWREAGMAVDSIRERARSMSPDMVGRVMAAVLPNGISGAGGASEEELIAAILREGLDAEEGAEAFDRALGSGLPQVVVSTLDLQARIEASGNWEEELAGDPTESEHRLEAHPRPELDTPFVEPSTDAQRAIAEIWCETLGIERIGIEDNFFDLGGDSLSATQLLARVRARFSTKLPMASFFDGPTVSALAQKLDGGPSVDRTQELAARVKGLSTEEKAALLEQARRARKG